jgi:hypothetical protein
MPGQIRLARVRMNHQEEGDVSWWCEMQVFSLDDHATSELPDYTAISYTWGNRKDLIVCYICSPSGLLYACPLTESAGDAIRSISAHVDLPSIFIWIDQVCIDQENPEEKATQVSLMKKIYERAGNIIVWLGPESDNSHLVIEKIREVSAFPNDGKQIPWAQYREVADSDDFQKDASLWEAMWKFLTREWFSRAWVLQEATANPGRTFFFCGEDYVHWHELNLFYAFLQSVSNSKWLAGMEFQGNLRFLWPDIPIERFMRFQAHRVNFPKGWPFLTLLEQVRSARASDPRDKLFPFIQFASDVERTVPHFKVDYLKPLADVLVDFVLWYLNSHRDLKFLGHCGWMNHDANRVGPMDDCSSMLKTSQSQMIDTEDSIDSFTQIALNGADLPSWVPDWTLPSISKPLEQLEDFQPGKKIRKRFEACGSWRLNFGINEHKYRRYPSLNRWRLPLVC